MRALALALILVACSEDPPPLPPHEFTDCDAIWEQNGYDQCEAACENSSTALNAMGPACAGRTSNGPVSCSKTFVYEGATGCCISSAPSVLFADCN